MYLKTLYIAIVLFSVPLSVLAGSDSEESKADIKKPKVLQSKPDQLKPSSSKPSPLKSPPSDTSGEMDNAMVHKLLHSFSDAVEGENGAWRFTYQDYVVQVLTDESANRMRFIVPIAQDDILTEALSYRLMQANFDSALDARYAIANKLILSTFVHTLKELNEELFFSGLAQTLTLAKTFGTTFSSGALVFSGGDSAEENRKLYEEIIKRSQKRAI